MTRKKNILNKRYNYGFTLIEIIVAIAIVGILAGIVVVNFGRNTDRDVRMERERLTSFLRDVQNKALTGEKVSGVSGVCGFGAHYNSSDNTMVQAYYVADANCGNVSKNYGTDLSADDFYFKNDVTVGNFSDIFFLIPNGEVYAGGAALSGSNASNISLTKGSVTIDPAVTIDAAGNIKNVN